MLEGLDLQHWKEELPLSPGSYALHLHLPQPHLLKVGRLGESFFPAGEYVYLGSARGPGGLRARLGRHLTGGSRPHWHIDVLRAMAQVRGWGYLAQEERSLWQPPLECCWAQALIGQPGAGVPVLGFGASDCRSGCPAHLVSFWQPVALSLALQNLLRSEVKWGEFEL